MQVGASYMSHELLNVRGQTSFFSAVKVGKKGAESDFIHLPGISPASTSGVHKRRQGRW